MLYGKFQHYPVLFLVILHDDGLGRFAENSHWIHIGFTMDSPTIHHCSQISIATIVNKSQISISDRRRPLIFVLVEMVAIVNNRNCADKCESYC